MAIESCLGKLGQRIGTLLVALTATGAFTITTALAQQEVAPSPAIESAKSAFIEELASTHNLDRDAIRSVLEDAQRSDEVLAAIQRPWEARPWHEYYGIFLTERRIEQGVKFWQQHAETLAAAYQEYGVPPELVVAIIGVETFYGQYMGNHRVLDALYSLGFYYPPRQQFFRSELAEFIRLAQNEELDVSSVKGSYAGAMGYGQFISSSYRAYAVDFDGDGRRDLLSNQVDAIGSVANYFARHRWQRGQPVAIPAWPNRVEDIRQLTSGRGQALTHTVGELRAAGVDFITLMPDDTPARLFEFEQPEGASYWVGLPNFYSITRYNHSPLYAMAVYLLSQELRHAYAQ